MSRVRQGVRWLLRRNRLEADIQREVDFHLEKEIEQRIAGGMTHAEARRTALRDFGGVVRTTEEMRDARGLTFWDALSQDVRFGLRTLRRSKGYTLAAVGILALGIGANTAMFSVIDGVLIKPLPFRQGHQLVLILESSGGSNPGPSVSVPELYDFRARLKTIADLVEYHGMSFVLLNQGDPDRVATGVVSASFFDVLGVAPLLGRTFVARDDDPGAEAVLVLSHGYWSQKFGGDPSVIGRVVQMNNRAHTIVGVLPDFPQYPRDQDVYMPVSACPFRSDESTLHSDHRMFAGLQVFGRLAEGATLAQASAEVAAVAPTFVVNFAKDYDTPQLKGFSARADSLEEQLVQNARPLLLALGGTTLLVLLIACANVANLAIGRTAQRSRELAVRAALGAGRGRLVRQLVTESTLVAVAGGALGLGFAWLTNGLLVQFVGRFTARTGQIAIDGGVLAFTLVASVVTGIAFGAVPALAARRNLQQSMRDGGAQSGEPSGRHRLRSALVVAQVAVSFVLLVGAALLLESFYRLATVPLGFQTDHVMTATIPVFDDFKTRIPGQEFVRIYTEILARTRALPGVTSASITNAIPFATFQPFPFPVRVERGAPTEAWKADRRLVSDGYFETLRIPLLEGREFRESDKLNAPAVAVINASMARFWRGRSPIGSYFTVEGFSRPDGRRPVTEYTVIGVVGDARQYGADRDVLPQYYTALYQLPAESGLGGRLMVRTTGDPQALIPAIKDVVHHADPRMPVEDVLALEEVQENRIASPKLTAALLSIFAGVALLITLAGLAGVIGTSVSQRTREFGLRMALGASRSSVLALVLRQGLVLVAAGLAAGLGGARLFSHLITKFLFATTTTDAAAYGAVAAVFVASALLAILAPARRATTIDPLTALRTE